MTITKADRRTADKYCKDDGSSFFDPCALRAKATVRRAEILTADKYCRTDGSPPAPPQAIYNQFSKRLQPSPISLEGKAHIELFGFTPYKDDEDLLAIRKDRDERMRKVMPPKNLDGCYDYSWSTNDE